jgi:dolichol-phosphate mannosyltransferase
MTMMKLAGLPERKRPLITLVIPVLNEEQNIERLHATVLATMAPVADRYDLEFLFTDNHSTDRSFDILEQLAARDARIRVLRFSRNFGYQRSILTGYLNASGDAVIQLDCDLQDPPAMILEFRRRWEEGYHVVYGVRSRRAEGWGITVLRKVFYRAINWLSEHPLPVDAGDFRLVDRRIVEELRRHDDANPYLRGIIATMGFRQLGVQYSRDARQFGESKFRFRQLMQLALDGIAGHSLVPLRIATYLSQAIFVVACLVIGVFAVARLTPGNEWPAGFATLAVLVLISTSINALLLGIQGEYIGRILRQVQHHPLTIVEKQIGGRDHLRSETQGGQEPRPVELKRGA